MDSATSQTGARLYIETVRHDTGTTEITIGNAGTEDTRIVRVWLGDSARNMTDITENIAISGLDTALNAGGTATITIASPNDLDSRDTILIHYNT